MRSLFLVVFSFGTFSLVACGGMELEHSHFSQGSDEDPIFNTQVESADDISSDSTAEYNTEIENVDETSSDGMTSEEFANSRPGVLHTIVFFQGEPLIGADVWVESTNGIDYFGYCQTDFSEEFNDAGCSIDHLPIDQELVVHVDGDGHYHAWLLSPIDNVTTEGKEIEHEFIAIFTK